MWNYAYDFNYFRTINGREGISKYLPVIRYAYYSLCILSCIFYTDRLDSNSWKFFISKPFVYTTTTVSIPKLSILWEMNGRKKYSTGYDTHSHVVRYWSLTYKEVTVNHPHRQGGRDTDGSIDYRFLIYLPLFPPFSSVYWLHTF